MVMTCTLATSLALMGLGCAKRPMAKVTIPSPGEHGYYEGDGFDLTGIPLTDMPEGPFSEAADFGDPEAAAVFKDVHFDYNKYDIRPGERPILEGIAAYLQQHPDVSVKVEGHCDERGSNEYNLVLGEKRALSIRDYLSRLGVDPARIYTVSYGEEQPLCTEKTESCWNQNRRGHFLLSRE